MLQTNPSGSAVARFRLSILEPLVASEIFNRGELATTIRILARREYQIPNSSRNRISEKTIQSWYYRWRHDGVAGLVPKVRIDRASSRLPLETQNAVLSAKKEDPRRSILQIIDLISKNEQFQLDVPSKSSVHRLLQAKDLSHQVNSFDQHVEEHFEVFNECFKNASRRNSSKEAMLLAFRWMLKVLQCQYTVIEIQHELGERLSNSEIGELLYHIRFGPLSKRNRAIIVLARIKNIPSGEIADFLGVSEKAVCGVFGMYRSHGLLGPFGPRKMLPKMAESLECKNAVFALLHSPPSSHDVNRTTWTLEALCKVLKLNGHSIGEGTISKIIKDAGFKFRKAKIVLTSTDPKYKEKLQEITGILANLKPNERFFSVDEYGPFAIKMQGGIGLVNPGHVRTIPQYQKSKGSLIVTAALELSENQVTHFYSKNKNTDEMIKLLNLLLSKYSNQSQIYFSWDAASWHASKKTLFLY